LGRLERRVLRGRAGLRESRECLVQPVQRVRWVCREPLGLSD
jgi:hypothetical protein